MKLKNYINQKMKGLALFIGLGLSSTVSFAQMNGSYTIDASVAASATNFQTWLAFNNAWNAAAITGPVTVTVKSSLNIGLNPITLNANTGSSATNTLSIDGGNTRMTYTGTNAALRLNGADYVSVKNMVIENTNISTPGGVTLTNQADYNEFNAVDVFLNGYNGTSSSTFYYAISASTTTANSNGSAATGATGQPGSFNKIRYCKMYTQAGGTGPYTAVGLNGNTANYTTTAQNNTMEGCTISNFYYYGVFMQYPNGNEVLNNDISRSNTTTGGSATMYVIYANYPYSSTRANAISGNDIHDLPFKGATTLTTNLSTFYGIFLNYPTGNATYKSVVDGNIVEHCSYSTGSRYVYYVNYPTYTDVTNNKVDNVDGSSTSSVAYDYYIYYPTDVKVNGNTSTNSQTGGYLYAFYCYYGKTTNYAFNEFCDNVVTNNITVNYLYSAYIYYYNGTNSWKTNRNYIVGNRVTGSTGYHYFYLYYYYNYEVIGNVVAGNYANSQYIYIYSGLSGSYTAEIRNNTFQANTAGVPTPGSSYIYGYFYLYYHTVYFTGNIIDLKGGGSNYYRYLYMYLSYSNPANLKEFNDNTYSLNNLFTYPYWYFNGTNYTDWAGFSGAGVNGSRDNGVDPKFVDIAKNDWRAGAWDVQNNVAYIAKNDKDCKSVSRNRTKHDRGGLETNTDLVAMSTNFTVPAQVCAGYTAGATWIALKSNYAYDKARNFNVSYSVNKGPKVSAIVTKQLAQGDSVKVYFPTPLVLNNAGPARIAIFIDLPDDDNSNDSFIFNTIVKPAPGGGVMTFTAKPTWANYLPSKAYDVTVLGQPVNYSVNSPRVYGNKDYVGNGGNNNWDASVQVRTKFGKSVTGGTLTAPTGTNDMVVNFVTTDKTLEDSILTVYVIVNDKGNGCDTVIKRDVLIYPTIVPDFTKPTQACVGEPVLFENKSTVTSGNMEFLWDFGTGKAADQTDAPDPVFVFTTPGTYKVKMVAKTLPYGFPSYDSATFQVNPVPTANFTKKNACEGYDLNFNNTTSPSNATVTWDFGDNKGTSTSNTPSYKYSSKGSYLVTMTANLAGCIAKSQQRVYQFEKPKSAFKVVSGDCDNKDFVFANNSSIGSGMIGSYWNFDDGNVSTDQAPKHIFASAGTKKVKLVTTSEFGCKDSITKNVVVKESPKVSFLNGPACSLKPTEFTNTTPAVANAIANYLWVFSDGTSSKLESPSHAWGSLGPKTATLTINLDNGCSASTTKSLDVLIQPKATFTAQDVCAGQPVVFNNGTTWAQGDISYEWDFSDNTGSTESDPTHAYNVNITTTYNVTLKARIAGGCMDSFTKQITINEGPKTCDFAATPDYAFGYYGMKFEPVNASGVAGAQGTVNYTWVIQNGGKQTTPVAQHNFAKDGTYSVTMYAVTKSTGCECSITKSVLMNRAAAKNLETVGVAVYPNPAVGQFNVALTETFGTDVNIVMTSMTGAVVKVMKTTNNGLIQVDASDLSEGVYMVRVLSGNKVATQKITLGH
jgi:PKD repeat protein